MPDPFEPIYSPRKIEFWLAHWEELYSLVTTPKSSAHNAEHLNREWMLLQPRLRFCLCLEAHAIDSMAVDPGCTHEPTGGSFRVGGETVLCVYADLKRAASMLPPGWLSTHRIWREQMVSDAEINLRVFTWRQAVRAGSAVVEREPVFSRPVAVNRMATSLGWSKMPALGIDAIA